MILKVVRISGHSLEPQYQDGDFVLVSRIPILLKGVQPGDPILFRHPTLGVLVKLVEQIEQEGRQLFVVGTNPLSHDSRTFGPISSEMVLGKVIGHIRKNHS